MNDMWAEIRTAIDRVREGGTTSLPAIVVRAEHIPFIINNAAFAASLGSSGQTALPGEPTDLVLVADGKMWGTLYGVRFLPVFHVDAETTAPCIKVEPEKFDQSPWMVDSDGWHYPPEGMQCGPWKPGDTAIVWDSFKPTIIDDFVDPADMDGFMEFCFDKGLDPMNETACLDWSRRYDCPITIDLDAIDTGPTSINLENYY